MKKHFFIVGVLSLFLSITSMAQVATDTTEVLINQKDAEIEAMRLDLESLSSRLQQSENVELDRIIWKNRAKYFNLAYVNQSLNGPKLGREYISDMGFSLSWGKTWYLHQRPIANMVKFGLDWSWLDVNYAKYTTSGENSGMGQVDVAMQVGPSVTVNPVDRLKASLYFRVSPTYSGISHDDLTHSYVTFCNFGLTLAWRVLSLGVEFRSGGAEYNTVGFETDKDDGLSLSTGKSLLATRTTRFYFGFRF